MYSIFEHNFQIREGKSVRGISTNLISSFPNSATIFNFLCRRRAEDLLLPASADCSSEGTQTYSTLNVECLWRDAVTWWVCAVLGAAAVQQPRVFPPGGGPQRQAHRRRHLSQVSLSTLWHLSQFQGFRIPLGSVFLESLDPDPQSKCWSGSVFCNSSSNFKMRIQNILLFDFFKVRNTYSFMAVFNENFIY